MVHSSLVYLGWAGIKSLWKGEGIWNLLYKMMHQKRAMFIQIMEKNPKSKIEESNVEFLRGMGSQIGIAMMEWQNTWVSASHHQEGDRNSPDAPHTLYDRRFLIELFWEPLYQLNENEAVTYNADSACVVSFIAVPWKLTTAEVEDICRKGD